MDRPDERLADALRARAVTGGYAPADPAPVAGPRRMRTQVVVALLVALLAGLLLGVGVALASMLVPGLLPPLG
ncbi:MAG: hypothetical protein ACT4RN_20310 [Pseudonocardia sp.]